MGFEVGDTQKLEAQYETLSTKLTTLRKKQADLNKTDLSQVTKSIDKIGESAGGVIKKIGRWVLAVFAIESAYGAVRTAMSTLSQYDEKIKANITYIQYAVANALKPLIEGLINLAFKLLTYVNYIAKAWFGVNLFANSSANSFKNANKQATKLKKTLDKTTASFDEINVLQKQQSSADTGTGAVGPSFDLSNANIPIPKWLQWIADNKDGILTFFTTLGLIIAGIKIASLLNSFGLFGEALSKIGIIIKGLGIGLILAGVLLLIKGIVDFIKDPSWKNFLTILEGVALIVAGIAILMGGWVVALIALGVAIVAYLIQNWDTVKGILGVIGKWIYDNLVIPITNIFKALFNTLLSVIKLWISYIKALFTTIEGILSAPFVSFKLTVNGIITNIKGLFTNLVSGLKKLFSGDLKEALNDFKDAFSNVFGVLWSIAKAPINLIIGGVNSLIKGLNKIKFEVPDWVPKIGGKKLGFSIPTISYLKTGGIINQPNSGIPVGMNTRGGESGAEGVIPLTDSQAMATLGKYIGKYVNIENVINNYMDSRKINRILANSNNRNSFASNG